MDICVAWEPLMPPSIDVILERLAAIDAAISRTNESLKRMANAVETQNGRVRKLEMEDAREQGARNAIELAAARARETLQIDAQAARDKLEFKDKSRGWKIAVAGIALGSVGAVSAIANITTHWLR